MSITDIDIWRAATRPACRSQCMKKSEDTSVEKSPKARRVPTKTGFKLRVALPTSQAVKGNGAVTTHARREWGASGDMKPWLPRRSPLEELSGYPTLSQTVNRIYSSRVLSRLCSGQGSAIPNFQQIPKFLEVSTMQIGFTHEELHLTVGKRYAEKNNNR